MWTSINQIVIPEFIFCFGIYSFYCAHNLKKIEIKNATTIPERLLASTSGLTTLILPSNLETIGHSFLAASGLKKLTIPASVTNIDGAFGGCNSDINITFEPGSPFSSENGFIYNSEKTRVHAYFGNNQSVEVYKKVKIIDGSTFSGNDLKTIILPPNLLEIGSNCFEKTQSLVSISLPASLTLIGDYCFYKSGIRSITIPGTVTLSSNAFRESSLETVIVKSGVSQLTYQCFYLCGHLVNVTIPSSVRIINEDCFRYSTLQNVFFEEATGESTLSLSRYSFSKTRLNTLVLPKQTNSIEAMSFSESLLTKVDMSKTNIEKVSTGSFKGCRNLTSITHSKVVKSFESSCFEDCGFTSFIIPNTVETLGPRMIGKNANLRTVIIEANSRLTAIVGTAFRGCQKLREFICGGEDGVFKEIEGVLTNTVHKELCVYPPAAFLDPDDTSAGLSYTVPSSVERIGQSAFLDSRLRLIELHKNIISIEAMAFDGCKFLRKILIRSKTLSVNALSFGGIEMGCGFIECESEVKSIIVAEAGVPIFAVERCITYDVRNVLPLFNVTTFLSREDE